MADIAIKFENVSKQYRLGLVGTGTISHDLNRWWYKVRGLEDPYLKIGETNDRSTKAMSDYVWALRDISFDVKQGEVLGIIGKNGAGKSTLLKILSRVTSPSIGSIKARGRIASLLEVGTGFHPEMTGRENIFMNGSIMGMTKSEIKSKLDEIINFAGVEKYIDTPVKRYSSGMTVRLGFAIAAYLEPEILVIDEVLAVGDAEFQKKAIGKMQDVSRGEGRTVLFVSHQLNSISALCNRCVLLENGQINSIGETSDVISKYLSSRNGINSALWINPGNEYLDENCTLQTISLVDASDNIIETTCVRNDQDFYVKFEFNIEILYSQALCIGFGLYDSNEQLIFYSYESDQSNNNRLTFKEGSNVIYVKIPSRLLNEGDYIIKPAINIYYQKWIIDPDNASLSISLSVKGGLSDSLYWQEKRSGVIAPVLTYQPSLYTNEIK